MKDKLKAVNWDALWKAVKEPLRLLVIGLVSFLVAELASVQNPEFWIPVAILVLRFIDKWMHEAGKAKGSDKLAGGLTRF